MFVIEYTILKVTFHIYCHYLSLLSLSLSIFHSFTAINYTFQTQPISLSFGMKNKSEWSVGTVNNTLSDENEIEIFFFYLFSRIRKLGQCKHLHIFYPTTMHKRRRFFFLIIFFYFIFQQIKFVCKELNCLWLNN